MSTRKPTRQQAAVSAKLDELDDFTSAQELHAQLRASGETVGLATVYRTLQNLAGDGTVDVLRTDDGEAIYRSCATSKHHHHLVCRNCGHTVEVEGPTVEHWADSVAAHHGFTEATHQIEIFGLCAQCSTRKTHVSL
ncbi:MULTISPECIES: Fur family transcriptional regulator [Dermacoccus]|uniref:Fur family transcriptional regulator n=1 Tax=Dermacoccus TaxID=57495 RepID=UPI00101C13CE|nr:MULTISPECIES: transcriptional repressor [Dermacoccus]MBZ4498081.1 transcriptional repressor [Dermacoccus sp. Tok2021]MCT1988031.1 transcriptional repressor [Dermacoccus abyssi]RYI21979.1 transcriptional repressor [Dermacoccus sp. 147Ba]